jgi:alkylhydroperoxidase family enzyme
MVTMHLLIAWTVLAAPPKLDQLTAAGVWTKPAVPLLANDAAWKHLPATTTPRAGPLPSWARMLAESLPNTTAAMLEFDRIHRKESPLDPTLRARLRWRIADANRCEYTKRVALLDLKNAKPAAGEVEALSKGDDASFASLPLRDRQALSFVKQLTLKGAELTDQQFADVLKGFGEKHTVAIVLLTAGANWQDKLFLSLGVPIEPDGPMAALDFRIDKSVSDENKPEAPERVLPTNAPREDWTPAEAFGSDWGERNLKELRGEMEKQKARAPRIRVPTAEEYLASTAKTPTKAGQPRRVPKVIWTLVCSGYQPELAAAWGGNTGSFRTDAKQDRVFEESLFWIVTRSIDCFY